MTQHDLVERLRECPHCHGNDTFVERADLSSCYVVCNDCGARGPATCNETDEDVASEDSGMEPGENAARRAWNTRLSSLPTHGEDVVERMARAIRFAENPLDGDPIGVMIHNYDFLDGSVPVEQQVAQIDDVCRAIARAALSVLPRIDQEVVEALIEARAELEAYHQEATSGGDHYNNVKLNAVISRISQGEGG